MIKSHIAVVLAAGFSRRYGSDKRLSGTTTPLGVQCIEKVCKHYCNVIVVHRFDDDELFINKLKHLNVDLVSAPEYGIGLGTSIATAAKFILTNEKYKNSATISLFLADMPYLLDTTIESLLSVAKENSIVRPTFAEQQGHPVIFGKAYLKQLSTLCGDEGAKIILRRNKQNLICVSVNDQGCIKDIDTATDWHS
ncbi:NTP transferase domain-containing protein [Thalassomonas sp. M1454]|uniref:nucleotidyltransferase family protein n=1 Tax=Thalassomonas sp. M1454 TaxID=2594477 RepID=UPI00117E59EC|nr:nucleotidyltransferase family protein [Thalassomonas sp. M1454]TRX56368.1 nucleotidyltransferase family protein [Thalassomonas sp. M1454]